MTDLEKLGFVRGMNFESIVSTYFPDRKPNVAPMGVTSEDMIHIVIKPFKTAQTYKNLVNNRCAVVNFTQNPYIFYMTAFKEDGLGEAALNDFFENASTVDAPRLREADAFIEVTVVDLKDQGKRACFICRVDNWKIFTSGFRPYCRGVFAAIESVIHATRIKEFLSQGKEDEAGRLIELVEYYRSLTERVSPKSQYLEIIDDLLIKAESWKKRWGR